MINRGQVNIKIALLVGNIKNAGDYLICKRSKELIKFVYPDCQITEFIRCLDMNNKVDEININDIAVIAGGPGFIMGEVKLLQINDLNSIKIPIFALGLGWFGRDNLDSVVYRYWLSNSIYELFKRVERDTKVLGCRDWYSVSILKNSGISSPIMTGCPAWYALEYANNLKINTNVLNGIKTICFSDPGQMGNLDSAFNVVNHIKNNFQKAKLKMIFHRGIDTLEYSNETVAFKYIEFSNKLKNIGVECIDISYSAEGFEEYNSCDLHIGFRVHAHIYNLSIRNISILIAEDARGIGVNEALGLETVKSFEYDIINNQCIRINNPYLIYRLDDVITNLWDSGLYNLERAYKTMNRYKDVMLKHIVSIKTYI